MNITSEKQYVIRVAHHTIVFSGDAGFIHPVHDEEDRIYFNKSALEELMAAFNWLYHETKPKEPK